MPEKNLEKILDAGARRQARYMGAGGSAPGRKEPMTVNDAIRTLLTFRVNLLMTYRYCGGSVRDAAEAFGMTVPEIRQAEAGAHRTLMAAGYDVPTVAAAYREGRNVGRTA